MILEKLRLMRMFHSSLESMELSGTRIFGILSIECCYDLDKTYAGENPEVDFMVFPQGSTMAFCNH